MCGRTVTIGNFNHCPTQNDFIQTANGPVAARWGLHFPHFLINARDDTKSQRFRQLRERKRCVVDALGYYEWKTTDNSKQPYYITMAGESSSEDTGIDSQRNTEDGAGKSTDSTKSLKLAGLYDVDNLGDGKLSYVTMTCSPSGPLADIHDRMPVILEEKDIPEWLSGKAYAEVSHLVKPFEKLIFYPVSTRVNDVRNNGPECIIPVKPKMKQSKLEFSNGVLITPEKKKRKLDLTESFTKDKVSSLSDKLTAQKPNNSKEIINLSDDAKPIPVLPKPKLSTPRKTPTKKLPKNQPAITKFFSPS